MSPDLNPRKPATIYDVAKLADVSTSTVSSVLNQSAKVRAELAERVHYAVRKLNFTPNAVARSLPLRKTRTVGLVIPDIENPFFSKVVHGVEDKLSDAGYSVIIGSSHNRTEEQNRYVGLFRAQQAAGLILFAAGDFERVREFTDIGRAVVFLGREPDYEADVVTGDNRETLRLAVEHLVRKSHRKVAILCGPLALSTNAGRVEGWRSALRAHGLEAPDRFIGVGNWSAEAGYSLARRMLSFDDPPTAIFAGNFLMLTGVLRALKERGLLCPRDVEVMCSGDSDWLDVFSPPISTVITPSYEMGSAAANLLLDRLQQPDREYRRVVLAPELRVRT